MKNYRTPLAIIFLFLCSFQQSPKLEDEFIGIWVPRETKGQTQTYHRSRAFIGDAPGMQLMNDGKLLMRLNNGWHEMQPILYEKYEGTWKLIDSTLLLKYKTPFGEAKEAWELSSISSTTLILDLYGKLNKPQLVPVK